ncbi:MAG: tetratricopeptide repeat protein [Owenweeksia sp.]
MVVDPDSALSYATQYLQLSKTINDSLEIATALDLIGSAYYYQNLLEKALSYHYRAHGIFKRHNDYSGLSTTHLSIGNVYNDQGYYLRAIDHYLQSMEYDKKIDYPEGEATTAINIAIIFMAQENYDLANQYIEQSIAVAKEYELTPVLANAYNLKSELLLLDNKIDEAEDIANKALKMALDYHDQFEIAGSHCNLGLIASQRGDHEKAIKECTEAVALMVNYGDPYSISLYKSSLARVFLDAGLYNEGLKHLRLIRLVRKNITGT